MGADRWLRRAGRAAHADGRILLWSIAEGGRGRRWRASTRDAAGSLLDDLLLEIGRDGRLTRLEAAAEAGQLTFHPEPDERAAHGNLVGPDGVRHLALAWAPGQRVEIPWSPIADAVLVTSIAGPGDLPVATVGRDLVPRARTVVVVRLGEGTWLVDGRPITVDRDGLPLLGPTAATWPLEDPTIASA